MTARSITCRPPLDRVNGFRAWLPRMNPESWKRVDELYHAARDRPVGERAAFLAEACRDDEALRRAVDSAALGPLTDAPITLVLGGSILWYVAPAAWKAWSSADVSGVSRGAWVLLLVESAVCTVYGVLADVPAYLVYAAIAAVGSVLVLASLAWRSGRECGTCPPLRRCSQVAPW